MRKNNNQQQISIDEDQEVDINVQNVKKQMSHFLGLLQKSISEAEHQEFQDQTPKHSQSQRKLSTILSANQDNEDVTQIHELPHQKQKQQQCENQFYYDQQVQTKQFKQFQTTTLVKYEPIIEISNPAVASLSARFSQASSKKSNPITGIPSDDLQKSNRSSKNIKMLNQLSTLKEFQSQFYQKGLCSLYQKLKVVIKDYTNYIDVLQHRNKQILVKCQRYRVKSQHLYKALQTLRKEEEKLVELFSSNNHKADQIQLYQKEVLKNNQKMSKQIQVLRSENSYLKQLIILANKNYESLQKKLSQSQSQSSKLESMMRQREKQFMQGNAVLKQVILSLGKQNKSKIEKDATINKLFERTNNSTVKNLNNKQQIEQTYRKMFIKNLKPRK